MTAIARPGTPFPHAHSISHPAVASSSMQYRYSAQPIHFQIRELPSPTPPSLLKRSSSQGSSSGYLSASPRTPPLDARRPSTTSLSSAASPVMPTTPRISLCAESEVPALELADDSESDDVDVVEPKLRRSRSGYVPLAPPPSPVEAPIRPKLKRRDTPRPATAVVETFATYAPRPRLERGKPLNPTSTSTSTSIYPSSAGVFAEDGPTAKRKYTSVIDGGHWMVLDV